MRLMHLAEKFHRPIVTLLDTTGAYPGIDAEERGQAEAIAVNLREMARLRVPVVSVVIGEGGSGGALGLGVANRVYMMENSIYSVISPESCAAIIWARFGQGRTGRRSFETGGPQPARARHCRRNRSGTGRRRPKRLRPRRPKRSASHSVPRSLN